MLCLRNADKKAFFTHLLQRRNEIAHLEVLSTMQAYSKHSINAMVTTSSISSHSSGRAKGSLTGGY